MDNSITEKEIILLKIKLLTDLIDTISGEIELTEPPQYASHEMVVSSIKDIILQYYKNQ